MKKTFDKTKRTVFCALLAGLSFVALYAGALTGVFDLCAVVIGSLCTVFAVIEFGGVYPWLVAAVCGTLAMLLLPDRMIGVEYILLGGIYPILKSVFEKRPRALSWIFKLLYFNAALTAALLLARFVFTGDDSWNVMAYIAYPAANIFFLLFDFALTSLISVYVLRLRRRIKGGKNNF